MPLPKAVVPEYEVIIPSTGKKATLRPFLVEEEKILLMAIESRDNKEMVQATKKVLSSCVSGISIDKLSYIDLEWLFLKLRSRSKGDVVNLKFQCRNVIKDEDGKPKVCGEPIKIAYNINNIRKEALPEHSKYVKLPGDITFVMKYPGFDTFAKIHSINTNKNNTKTRTDVGMEIIMDSIEAVFQGEQQFEFNLQELKDFFDVLPVDQFQLFQNFFATMPTLRGTIEHTCKCGHHETIEIKGLASFLD
jgi:hypothetical protein